jgi:DNA-binding beta-propeller fold protein YncE
MNRKQHLFFGAALAVTALVVACAGGAEEAGNAGGAAGAASLSMDPNDGVPTFEVDPLFPKNLPNHWLMGPTIGVDVDSRDHIWVVHRNTPDQFVANTEVGLAQDPPVSECCQPGPPVLEFDQEGNLVSSWGGPGTETGDYVWPSSNHGITVDGMDNIWIGGNGGADSHVLKMDRQGNFLMQVGTPGARMTGPVSERTGQPTPQRDSHAMDSFGRVAKIGIDNAANEAYFADGYFNKRIAVVDMDTGEIKRYWGAYGNEPDDDADLGRYSNGSEPAQQFRGPVHCSEISDDGMVYVCDRGADRIQVFQKDGTFVSETIVAPATLSQGSTWDIDFSHDAEQKYIYLADGQNMKVYIIERATMEVLTAFGDGGRQPGMFFAVHSIAVDSMGNIFTTETYEGSRLQKFTFKGYAPVPAGAQGTNSQGVLWPTN